MKKWFIGLLLITLTLGCIACAEDANQDNPTNKTESLRDNSSITTTNSELPSITAFTAPDSVPPINPMKFATTKEDIDQTFLKLFGETYYTTHTELASHYEPHDLNKLRQALADLAQITSWNYQVNYFDCSEMTALTEYALEAAGFQTLIVAGYDVKENSAAGHAWNVVIIHTPQTQLIPIEATTNGGPAIPNKGSRMPYKIGESVGYQTYDDYISEGYAMENIYQAHSYNITDFDWWKSCQIDTGWTNRFVTQSTPESNLPPKTTPTPIIEPTAQPEPFSVNNYAFLPNRIQKGSKITAKLTISGGEPGQYILNIREDISFWPDENVGQHKFYHDGNTTTVSPQFIPSTEGTFYMGISYNNVTLWHQANDSTRLEVK